MGRAGRPALAPICDTCSRGRRRTAPRPCTRTAISDSARANEWQEGLQVDVQLAGLSVRLGPEILPLAALTWRLQLEMPLAPLTRLITSPTVGINTAVVVIGIATSRPWQTVTVDVVCSVLASSHLVGPAASDAIESLVVSHDATEGQ